MKKILILILAITAAGYLSAQEEKSDNIETLFSKPSKIRGYIAPITTFTTIDGETAYMSGVNVAGIFNDHFVLGFYNLNLENNIFSNNDNYVGSRINFDHRGIWLGYIFMPQKMVHFNINANAGKGNLEIYDDVLDQWINDDFVFVVTPSLEVEFNMARFLRIGIGANYRFALDVNGFDNYSNSDFSDFGGFINFKFGWF